MPSIPARNHRRDRPSTSPRFEATETGKRPRHHPQGLSAHGRTKRPGSSVRARATSTGPIGVCSRRRGQLLACLAAALASTQAVQASAPPASEASDSSPRIAQWRAATEQLVARERLPGLSVAVMQDGSLLWSEGFGFANLEHQVPTTPQTKFRVGSVSKALTSAAIGALVESGQLDLDESIRTYVPEYPDKGFPITTRQLAGHLSGIPHYQGEDIVNQVRYRDVIHALDKFKDRPLLFEPGTDYAYSSFGWNLIAAVVQRAAEEPFLRFMQESVFEPASMDHTIADHYDLIIPHRTAFYGISNGVARNAPAVDNSDVWAGGGFLSTSEDLVRFGHAMLSGMVVDEETLNLLFTSQKTSSGKETGYGLGWQEEQIRGHAVVGHGGSHVGATADLLLVPDQFLIVAALTNAGSSGMSELTREIVTQLLP